jgi:hypothetical protein
VQSRSALSVHSRDVLVLDHVLIGSPHLPVRVVRRGPVLRQGVAAQVDPFESKGLNQDITFIGSQGLKPGGFQALWVNWFQGLKPGAFQAIWVKLHSQLVHSPPPHLGNV